MQYIVECIAFFLIFASTFMKGKKDHKKNENEKVIKTTTVVLVHN